jgi:asparaginyl-tRNA synthetase
MKYSTIQGALDKGKGKVSLRGWVYRERKFADKVFVVLRDASNIIQCVIKKEAVPEKVFKDAESTLLESSVEITGELNEDKRAPGGYELKVSDFKVIQFADRFPITKDQSPEFLLDNRHLWLRSRKMVAIMKIRHTILQAFREHYVQKGFFEFSPPILQPTQCEGGSTLFPVKYYNEEVFLSQTAQLYSEAMVFALEKIFTISPTFRAEKSKTSRHLSEFWMAEMEAVHMDLKDLCDDIEKLLCHIVEAVLKRNRADLDVLERDVSKLEAIKAPFPRMTYTEVLDFLKEKDKLKIEWGKDLRTTEEEKLSDHFDKPVLVTHYPKDIMAFYKTPSEEDDKVALCLDVIAPEHYGEIIGGSIRDLDIERMKKILKAEGEDPAKYEWYFDSRRFGSVPHAGHGMGVERVVAWICGLDNIKDAIPFPRTMLRWKP